MPERPDPDWSDAPLDEWVLYGCERLARFGFDEDDYRRVKLRERILDSIAWVFWDHLTRAAESSTTLPRRPRESYIEQTIARLLGLHRAQAERWKRKRVCPSPDTFFGTLVVVLKKEIVELEFPRNRDVAWISSRRTLDLIRRDDCRRDRIRLSPEEQSCLWSYVRHPRSAVLAAGGGLEEEEGAARVAVYSDVLKHLAIRFPAGKVRTARMMGQVIDAWIDPFTMFLAGLIPGWELDDVPAAQR